MIFTVRKVLHLHLILAACLVAGCATVNDSGVPLHKKPDLANISPGTPIAEVADLRKPDERTPIAEGRFKGSEVLLYEWDLPNDEVNNRMYTRVMVKDGIILGYTEETSDKWQRNPHSHKIAKLDSAFEDIASLKARAARYPMGEPLPAPGETSTTDTRSLLMKRSHFILQDGSGAPANHSDSHQAEVLSFGSQVGPSDVAQAGREEQSMLAAVENSGPLPGGLAQSTSPAPPSPVPAAQQETSTTITAVAQHTPFNPSSPKTLSELEAEELRIRKDASLTKTERMQKLREIWEQQLAVTGKKAA